jgi:hypothetical protein
MYSVRRLLPEKWLGPAENLEQALILADADGPGRYEVLPGGDPSKHLCFITRREDGTFILDPRCCGGWAAALGAPPAPAGCPPVAGPGRDRATRAVAVR